MATAMEYDVLREIAADISGIFFRKLEDDDEEGQTDRKRVNEICRDIINNTEYEFINYEDVKNELIPVVFCERLRGVTPSASRRRYWQIRDKYNNRS